MARLTAFPRAQMLLLSACALICAQVLPVLGEPTGTVPAKADTAAKTTATVAAKSEAVSKLAATAKADETSKSACTRDTFRVVIDVGHTAGKPGAISARGVYEYDFNLKLATLIDKKLHDAGFTKSVLLITKDVSRYHAGLFKRAERARAMNADLFLSIHHDSVPDSFLQKWEYNGVERFYSDRFKGHSIFVSRDNSDYRDSLMFAKMLGHKLKDRGLKYTPHYVEKFMGHRQRILVDADVGVYRYDQLIVLKNNRVPAALLEAGSIINRDEELQMASPKRRGIISDAAVEAIQEFCESRSTRVARSAQPAPSSKKKISRAGMRAPRR